MSPKEFNILLGIIGIIAYLIITTKLDLREAQQRSEDLEYLLYKERQERELLDSRYEEYREYMIFRGMSPLEIDERIMDLKLKEVEYFMKAKGYYKWN